jgi:hypothetical protein
VREEDEGKKNSKGGAIIFKHAFYINGIEFELTLLDVSSFSAAFRVTIKEEEEEDSMSPEDSDFSIFEVDLDSFSSTIDLGFGAYLANKYTDI